MVEVATLVARGVPRVVSSLRAAYSRQELANALTGEQGWTRKVLVRRDGFKLIASSTAEEFHSDPGTRRELEGTIAQWDAVAEDVATLLADAFGDHDALLDLVRDPEHAMQRCLDLGGRRVIEGLRGEEPAASRITALLACSLGVVAEIVRYAGWFAADATVDQMRSQLRDELLARETQALIAEIHAATVAQSSRDWPASYTIAALNRTAEYYPEGFSNRELAKDLLVTRVDDTMFASSGHEDLYWAGRVYGEPERLENVLRGSAVTVLLGNPGSGKSTLAKDLVVQAVDGGTIAAFARLADVAPFLASKPPLTGERDALAAISHAMTQAVSAPVNPDILLEAARGSRQAGTGERTLVVLDGLDEVPSAAGQAAVKQLVNLLTDCGYRLVITSRIAGYSTPLSGATHLAVLPIADTVAARTADRWFVLSGSAAARDRYQRTVRQADLSELTSNPLMLGFMCFVAHHEEVPSDQASVFDRFVDHFLRRKWHAREHWIDDDAQVARSHRAAATVAWAMAMHKQNEIQLLWKDSEVLETLEDWTNSPDVAYEVYLTGLLIPHGLRESPFSRRFQRVRWMHRSIHEYFAATVLARSVEGRAKDWWKTFQAAALHPSWSATIHQTCQLLGDGPVLHGLLDALQGAIEERDTPDHALTGTLALVAKYCSCPHLRSNLAKFLADGRSWQHAFILDFHVTTELAVEAANRGDAVKQIASALHWRRIVPLAIDQVEKLVDAGVLNLDISEDALAVWDARLSSDIRKWWPDALAFAETQGRLSVAHGLPELEPEILAEVADNLVKHFNGGSSSISGTEIAFLDEKLLREVSRREDLPPRLKVGLDIKALYGQEEPDFSALASGMLGDQHPQDVIAWGPLLELHTEWKPANEQQKRLVSVGRAAHYLSNVCGSEKRGGWKIETGEDLTIQSLSAAEAIINGFRDDEEYSSAAIESLLWALSVLVAIPSSRVYDRLLDWYRGQGPRVSRAEFGKSSLPLDSSDFVAIINAQDWRTLTASAFQDISQGKRLARAGGILCQAASIWTAPATRRIRPVDYHPVSSIRAAEMWLEGLQAQLLDGKGPYSPPDMLKFLPEGLPEDLLIRLAHDVVNLTSGFSVPVAIAARVGAERALAASGALAYFYEEIALPRGMSNDD